MTASLMVSDVRIPAFCVFLRGGLRAFEFRLINSQTFLAGEVSVTCFSKFRSLMIYFRYAMLFFSLVCEEDRDLDRRLP